MPKRDFYDVLGVSRTATEAQIKAAYRKLARKLHPDVNKADDAQARFSELQEAYEALSDAEKRKVYDRFGHAGVGAGAGGAGPAGWGRGGGGGPHYTWSNVGGPGGGASGASGGGGSNPFAEEDLGSVFESFFGSRGEGFGARGHREGRGGVGAQGPSERGADVQHEIVIDFAAAAAGGTRDIEIVRDGSRKTITVKIPKAVLDGTKLRVRKEGHPAPRRGGPAGDLILTVRVKRHPTLRRGTGRAAEPADTLDLSLDLPVSIADATLGGTVPVQTLGGEVTLTIPPGTSSGAKLRLKGRGLSRESGRAGDLFAVVQVRTPQPAELTPELRAALIDWRNTIGGAAEKSEG
ncbi:MAG: DnaJ-class molecular chaperone [Phycisphaerales bacterium]|jgi:DnaJ-class molecular chaperone